jgi:hypothetical protein
MRSQSKQRPTGVRQPGEGIFTLVLHIGLLTIPMTFDKA